MAVLKVFVSSTFRDLEAHRAAVIQPLRALDDVQLLVMEDWTAHPDQAKTRCLDLVRDADVFVVIIGQLYGYVPGGDDRSITQYEYETAVGNEKDILAFVCPVDMPVPVPLILADPNLAKQGEFRQRVLTNQTCDLKWSTPDQLASRVMARDQQRPSWRIVISRRTDLTKPGNLRATLPSQVVRSRPDHHCRARSARRRDEPSAAVEDLHSPGLSPKPSGCLPHTGLSEIAGARPRRVRAPTSGASTALAE